MRKGLLEPAHPESCDEWPTGEVGWQTTVDPPDKILVQQWARRISPAGAWPLKFTLSWRECKDVTHLIPQAVEPVAVIERGQAAPGPHDEVAGMSTGSARQWLHSAAVEMVGLAGDAAHSAVDQCVAIQERAIAAWKMRKVDDVPG